MKLETYSSKILTYSTILTLNNTLIVLCVGESKALSVLHFFHHQGRFTALHPLKLIEVVFWQVSINKAGTFDGNGQCFCLAHVHVHVYNGTWERVSRVTIQQSAFPGAVLWPSRPLPSNHYTPYNTPLLL